MANLKSIEIDFTSSNISDTELLKITDELVCLEKLRSLVVNLSSCDGITENVAHEIGISLS